ncbi:N-6 DNA methylase [Streptomyces sp. NBC_00102]|uniref:N-6 DNA methylase n=1 Tax=Streptomyces sp. NBC_00102 TaxID=2975652 RepID=UPI00224ED4A0|nr:N-6 DNA methylase [Streptomyces sp. NBC_00102]MCX5400821.1 N-6 DNA methylase [Streptomyces sp. NBC_00102]
MPQPPALVTAAEISRIAGVTRATVSNWRRRHDDFPAPSGGTDSSPLYDLEAVRAWLEARGQSHAASPSEELRTVLRLHGTGSGLVARLFPLVLAASRHGADELAAHDDLPDSEVLARAGTAAAEQAGSMPETGPARFGPDDVPALRALMRCVRGEGAQNTLDVLAERELDDTASSGTYPTPPGLAGLLARLLPEGTTRVLDPACGSGSLLAAAARRGATELYGQDSLPVQAQRSAVRLLLSSPGARVTVRVGDTLRADAFPDLRVAGVLCNPPYGDREWGHEELAYDQRWAYGVPPRIESELAWTQHALAHLEAGGHAVMLLPPATATRASGRRVRAELVRSGALRAVVGLPVGASVPLHIGLHVWVLRRPEPQGTDSTSVLFVDVGTDPRESAAASTPGDTHSTHPTHSQHRNRRGAVDWDALSDEVLTHWTAFRENPETFADTPGTARAVPTIDLVDDLVDLTPARQVRAAPVDIEPAQVARRTEERRSLLVTSLTALESAADHGPWRAAAESSRTWRTATVSDLARGGALSLLRAAVPGSRGETSRTDDGARPVLTASDISGGGGPSGTAEDLRTDAAHTVATGDVLVRAVAGGHGGMARVADEADAGALLGHHVHLLRPDPARLDPWFLAGFLGAHDNIAGASTGSTILHVAPGRLRVPLLPLEEQRRYGAAFRHAHELRTAARRTAALAEETAQALLTGLTAGALLPPENLSA